MTDVLTFVDNHIFSGSTGNLGYDILKRVWKDITQKSWEDIYLDAFQRAFDRLKGTLKQNYASTDGDVEFHRHELQQLLHQNLSVTPTSDIYFELVGDEFLARLIDEMVAHNILTIGGNNLTVVEYSFFMWQFVQQAKNQFRELIINDETKFKQLTLTGIEQLAGSNKEILQQVNTVLGNFGLLIQHVQTLTERVEYIADKLELQSISTTVHQPPKLVMSTIIEKFKSASSSLRSVRHTIYHTSTELERPEIKQILDQIQGPEFHHSFAVVVGKPGDGKTVVMRSLLVGLEQQQVPVLGINAEDLLDVTDQYQLMQKFQLPATLEECAQAITATGPCIILIDQLDALATEMRYDRKTIRLIFETIDRLRGLANIRILASCRSFEIKYDPQLKNLEFGHEFHLAPVNVEEIDKVLGALGQPTSQSLSSAFRELLRVPLHLDLYARVVSDSSYSAISSQFTTLQDFYNQLWQLRIETNISDEPTSVQKQHTVYRLLDAMEAAQQATVPEPILDGDVASGHLRRVGFIELRNGRWQFLHRTLFDYCYARRFIASGQSLSQDIFGSPQGLFQRAQLIQVLAYLRQIDPQRYIQELRALLFDSTNRLRFHLRLLLSEWLGALPTHDDNEVRIIKRLWEDTVTNRVLFRAISGDKRWLTILADHIKEQLQGSDNEIGVVMDYLYSIINLVPNEVVAILRPYIGRSDTWDKRIALCLRGVRNWENADEPVDILCDLILRGWVSSQEIHFQFHNFASTNTKAGCKILHAYLVIALRQLQQYLASEPSDQNTPIWNWEQNVLEDFWIREIIEYLAYQVPSEFLALIIPWFIEALSALGIIELHDESYPTSKLFWMDYSQFDSNGMGLIDGIVTALKITGQSHQDEFKTFIAQLETVEMTIAQNIIARAYATAVETYRDNIITFLFGDQRRMFLIPDMHNLLALAFPLMSDSQRVDMEKIVLDLSPKKRDKHSWQDIYHNQFSILARIPDSLLSEKARKKRLELSRRFPDYQWNAREPMVTSGIVQAPVPQAAQTKMSDADWLSAMKKYDGSTTGTIYHDDIFRGGIREQAGVLQQLTQTEPDRFYNLIIQHIETVPLQYVMAVILGLVNTQLDTHAGKVFSLFGKIYSKVGHTEKIDLCRAATRLIKFNVPDNLVDIISEWALTDEHPPVEEYDTSKKGDQRSPLHDILHNVAINSVRGVAIETVGHILRNRKPSELARLFEFLEITAKDKSLPVLTVVIKEIGHWADETKQANKAIHLIDTILADKPILLSSVIVQNIIYWLAYHDWIKGEKYVKLLLENKDEPLQEVGGRFASLLGFQHKKAEVYAEQAMNGNSMMKQGAALVYARNISHRQIRELCKQRLLVLFNDDDEVMKKASNCFRDLRSGNLMKHQELINGFLQSTSLSIGDESLAEYLADRASIETTEECDFALTVIARIVENAREEITNIQTGSAILQHHIVPLLLQIYHQNFQQSSTQSKTMDILDNLLALGGYNQVYEALRTADDDWFDTLITKH